MAKVYDTATDLITFARSSSGTALRRVGYGDELVDTANTASSWQKYGNNTVEQDGDAVKITYVDNSSGGFEYLSAAHGTSQDLVVGKVYKMTLKAKVSAGAAVTVRLYGQQTYLKEIAVSSDTYVDLEYTFVGEASHLINTPGMASGESIWLKDISVKEVIFDRATDDLVLFDHPDDIPRIEYAADGSLKGLLIEEARTNLVTTSAQGIYGNSPGSTQQTTGPDGSTGDYVPVPDGGSDRFEYSIGAGDFANGTELTVSWFAKRLTGTPSSHVGELNLNSHVGVTVGTAYEVEASAGGWTRYAATVTVTDNSAQQRIRLYFGGTVGFGNADVAYFGFQLEAGSFATSYIPTSGSQSTRSPDIASIPVSAFGYNQEAGTVVVEFDTASTDGTSFPRVWSLSTSASSNTVELIGDTGNDIRAYNYNGTTAVWNSDILNDAALLPSIRAALAITNGDGAATINGGNVITSSATEVVAFDTLSLGRNRVGSQLLNGHIKSLSYFPRRLTDAQLQELTA